MQVNTKKLINRAIETLDKEREGWEIEVEDIMVEEIIIIYANYIENERVEAK